jgi:hypothetical protein
MESRGNQSEYATFKVPAADRAFGNRVQRNIPSRAYRGSVHSVEDQDIQGDTFPTRPLPLSKRAARTPLVIRDIEASLKENVVPKSLPKEGTVVDFSKQAELRKDPDYLFSKEWLIDAVNAEKEKPLKAWETPWYHLAGTGFWVKEQVSQLMNNVTGVGREAFPDVLELELSKVKEDFIAFESEYLRQQVSLKWNIGWGEKNGEKKIIAPDYNNKLLEDVTSSDERDGVVFDTLFGNKEKGISGVQDWLQTAPENSFAIIVSPKGWSGLHDAAGNPITYPEAQVYGIQTLPGGKLKAFTFRLDATIDQNEAFQQELGLSIPRAVSEKERIKNTFSNVALITPEDAVGEGKRPIRSFKDVIAAMQHAVGGREEAYQGKKFKDMEDFVDHPENFEKRHSLSDMLIGRFLDYAKWRFTQGGTKEEIAKDLQIALAFEPIHLNMLYREEGRDNSGNVSVRDSVQRLSDHTRQGGTSYAMEVAQLQELPGCAGGGSIIQVTTMGSSRKGEIANSSASSKMDCVTCPFCSETVDAIVEGSKIECPKCHASVNK